MSTKLVGVGVAVLGNTATTPFFWTTKKREASPGACCSETGSVKVRPPNAGWRPILVTAIGRTGAVHDGFAGRWSMPKGDGVALLMSSPHPAAAATQASTQAQARRVR